MLSEISLAPIFWVGLLRYFEHLLPLRALLWPLSVHACGWWRPGGGWKAAIIPSPPLIITCEAFTVGGLDNGDYRGCSWCLSRSPFWAGAFS